MPSDLASYLADHYLTADPKPSKKRKRKHGDSKKTKEGAGLLIQDDDDDAAWTKPSSRDADADELSAAATIAGTSAEFRRATKSSWKTLGGGGSSKTNTDHEAAAADAILASAAAESAAARDAEDDAPVVEGAAVAAVKMSDGTHAGLQTAATVAAQLQRRRAEEKAQYERERAERRAARGGGGDSSGEEETVFRDATGRRIDVTLQREQKRKAEAEKERAAKEALKGEVQIEEARRRREKLEDAALMPLARGKDDEEMNNAMKSEQRWNDPMMQFMSENDKREAGGTAKTGGRRVKGRPVYKGPAAPNRYGIRPGYRWDGVDRGIGFEAERFKALNRRERTKDLEYNWQMDE